MRVTRHSDARGKDHTTTRTVTIRGEVIPNPAGRNFNMNPNEQGMAEIRRVSRADQFHDALGTKAAIKDVRRIMSMETTSGALPAGASKADVRLHSRISSMRQAMREGSGAPPADMSQSDRQLWDAISSETRGGRTGIATGAVERTSDTRTEQPATTRTVGLIPGTEGTGNVPLSPGSIVRTNPSTKAAVEELRRRRAEAAKGGGGPDEYNRDEQGRFAPK